MKMKQFKNLCQEYKIPKSAKRTIKALIRSKTKFSVMVTQTYSSCLKPEICLSIKTHVPGLRIKKIRCK